MSVVDLTTLGFLPLGDSKVPFVVGRRYRMRNGSMSDPIAHIEGRLMTDFNRVWGIDGSFSSKGAHEFDLLPDE